MPLVKAVELLEVGREVNVELFFNAVYTFAFRCQKVGDSCARTIPTAYRSVADRRENGSWICLAHPLRFSVNELNVPASVIVGLICCWLVIREI